MLHSSLDDLVSLLTLFFCDNDTLNLTTSITHIQPLPTTNFFLKDIVQMVRGQSFLCNKKMSTFAFIFWVINIKLGGIFCLSSMQQICMVKSKKKCHMHMGLKSCLINAINRGEMFMKKVGKKGP